MKAHPRRQFWLGTILTTLVVGAGLHFWWKPRLQSLPPLVSFPINREVYPCAYGKGIADHYLYYFGILGFGDRLRNSDVICIGTSHFMYGLSAAHLTEHLTSSYGRPVKAYNMGLGFADVAFQAECFARLGLKNKTVVVDSFAPMYEQYSDWALKVQKSDIVGAYVQVGEIWSEALRDWTFDHVFPRIFFTNGEFSFSRYMNGTVTRHWDSGDVEAIWSPGSGAIFQRGVPPFPNQDNVMGHGEGRFPSILNHGVTVPQAILKVIKDNSLKTILVLYPFESYLPEVAEKISTDTGYPLILIPPDGLHYRDSDHLNAPSRDKATDRIFDMAREQGIDFLNPKVNEVKK